MTCPECEGANVELPEPGYPAWCPDCDRWFRKVDSHEWWGLVVEVYVPTVNGES